MSELETCSTCGRYKLIEYYGWKSPLSPKEISQWQKEHPGERFKVCKGHPKPATKHDGNLNEDSTHNVYYNNFGGIAVSANGVTWMDAREALALLDWLKQEEATLRDLAKEQEGKL